MLRDYAFKSDDPSAFTVVEAFNKEFGYELGDSAFTHLFKTGDSNISQDSFEVVKEPVKRSEQNHMRSLEKVRKLGPAELEIPSQQE
ncbi:MAG: hypothetical protein ABEI86_07415, partial [Halobacteriaceae archaeon]